MKRMMALFLALMVIIPLFATKIEFKDNSLIECDIVGKQADTLFISFTGQLFKICKDDISKVDNGGGNMMAVVFAKKDWIIGEFDVKKATKYKPVEVETPIPGRMTKEEYRDSLMEKPKLKTVDDMTDREFQEHLMKIQANAINEHAHRVTGTMWTIWGVSLGISVVGTLIMIASI